MHNKTAFVLMPFDEEFNDVYKHLICDCLVNAGYDVTRADEIKGQNNILGDIVGGIVESDLIVADLTGANPNVYYELGIAHALNKNVILITQAIEELPFDLRSYRVIGYSTHFSKMHEANKELRALATEAFNGKLIFGNPIKDFGNMTNRSVTPVIAANSNDLKGDGEDFGLLDYQVMLEEGFEKLTDLLMRVGNGMNDELTPKINETATQIGIDNLTLKQKRNIIKDFAMHLNKYGTSLKSENANYKLLLNDIESALENMLGGNYKVEANDEDQLQVFLKVLESIQLSANGARGQIASFIEVVEALPKMEKDFNRAKQSLSLELKSFVDNVDLTVSIIARGKILGDALINKLHRV